jgi:hypothetical protein
MNYREEIKIMTGKIPKSVVEGGVMQAALWKERASQAHKLASNPKTTVVELKRAFEEMQRFT